MGDLWAALGLVLVIEGALYALFPEQMIRTLQQLGQMPAHLLRVTGLVAIAIGWVVVWWVRSP
ncbi:MAG: DUF2065 domain-containing protein [Mariprofundaceae bacterium]